MSIHGKFDKTEAEKVVLIPSDIYFSHEADKAAKVKLKAQSALEEMYAYFGSDRA